MSTTIDNKVVQMQFDNKHFEDNVQTSLSTLDKLKKGLDLSGASKGLENVGTAAKGIDMSGLSTAVETVRTKFSALQVMAITALSNITNQAVNAGKRIVSSLTIDPIKMGFQEYETQINAVQTILANTESKGKTLTDVTAALDELNTYADKTIYNFTEMTRNIGTFTAAGVDLDTSVAAIKGIANLAAVSGSTSQQASTAMYQLSQALASGTVKLMDWNSVVNAGMGGQVFQDALKETARVHGVAIDQMIEDEGSFRETLSLGWLTSNILTETLSKFTGDLNEEQLKTMGYTDEQIASIIKMGQTANDAATKVKTFTQLFDTLKEAAQSGWTQSWEIIVGDFEEAKALLTEISDIFGGIIGASANARNEMLQGWKDLGGRTALIESVRNAFEGIMSVITPIKEAFREIFPPLTSQQLYDFTVALQNLTEKLKLSDEQSANLKSTFKGLFAALDIGRMAIVAVWEAIAPLIKEVFGLGDGILKVTGSWGDWMVNLRNSIKETNVFGKAMQKVVDFLRPVLVTIKTAIDVVVERITEFVNRAREAFEKFKPYITAALMAIQDFASGLKSAFEKVKDLLSPALEAIKNFAASVKEKFVTPGFEVFHALLERLHIRMSQVGEAVGDMKTNMSNAFKDIGDAISNSTIFKVLTALWNLIKTIAGGIAQALGSLMGGLVDSIGNANFEGILDLLNGLTVGGLALAISKFVKNLSSPIEEFHSILEGFTGILDGVKGILDGVRGCFEEYQKQLKANTLIKIASAIAILTASILTLSLIDSDKLTDALFAITTLFTELMLSMSIFTKITDKTTGTTKAATTMIAMSASVLILASAMKSVAELDYDQILRGSVGIATMTATMVAAVKLLSGKSAKKIATGSVSLIALATSVKILASACTDLAALNKEELTNGLVAIGVLLAEIAVFSRLAKFGGQMISGATGMVVMSAALLILAKAVEELGGMSWEVIGKGLVAVTAGMIALAAAMKLMPKMFNLSSVAGLVAMTGALFVLQLALESLGSMTWEEIGKSLVVLAGSLAAITVAMNFMIGALPGAAALLVVSGALAVLALDLKLFIGFEWNEIGKGLVVIAGALTILAVAMTAMTATLPGAAALAVASASLLLLAPALAILGAMSWGSIVKGLVALAGTFAVLGVAGLVLAPLTPVILGLSAALALIGVAALGIGTGLIAAGAGLHVIAGGLGAIATVGAASATAVVAALTVIITGVAAMIPTVLTQVANGLIAILDVIIAATPKICETVVVIVVAVCKALVEAVPVLVETILVLLVSAVTTMKNYMPTLVQTGFDILISVLKGIRDNISQVVQIAIDVILQFLDGIRQKLPDIIQAGFDMLVSFLDGIATAIDENTERMIEAMNKLILALLDAAVAVLENGPELFKQAAKRIMDSGFIQGIKDKFGAVKTAVGDFLAKAKETITEKWTEFKQAAKDLFSKFIQGIKDKYNDIKTTVTEFISEAKSKIEAKFSEFKQAGKDLIMGFIQGIKDKALDLYNTAKQVVSDAVDGVKDFLGINSPSKAFAEIGRYSDEGFIVGLKKYSSNVNDAATDVGDGAVTAMSKAIAGISDVINNDIDSEPTIRPVLDLSNVTSGAKGLNALFSRTQALSVSAQMNRGFSVDAEGGSNSQNGGVISFTQNNYSPKPLSRLEIYRQTKNQFSAMKEVLET